MTIGEWVGVLMLGGAISGWLLRMERLLTRAVCKLDDLSDEQKRLRRSKSQHTRILSRHGERLSRLEGGAA